jgi:hypothetical protein
MQSLFIPFRLGRPDPGRNSRSRRYGRFHGALMGWCLQMDMLIGGRWQSAASGRTEDVTSPFDGAAAGTVPVAEVADVQAALDLAARGAITWRGTPAFERTRILTRAAELADERAEQIAQIINAESGKAITEARGEASRSGDLIRLSAFEGSQLYGDSLPLDAHRGTGLAALVTDPAGPQGLLHRIDRHRPAHHRGGRDQEAVPGTRLLVPGDHLARRGHRACRQRGSSRRIHQRGPGLHLGPAGHHPPGHRRGLPGRAGPQVEAIRTGDPRAAHTTMGTLISAAEAERVEQSVRGVAPDSPFSQDKLFGPAVTDVKTVILHGRPW